MKRSKVVLTIILLMTLLSLTIHTADAARIAVLKDIKGDVYILKGGGKKEFKAKNGMSLSQGDSVRTTKKSSANITYDDGSKATVGASSKVVISKLSNNKAGKQTKAKVVSGKVWNSVQNLANVNDEYDVETPTAVMGVRGTQFLVTTDPITGKTTVSVFDGAVGVSQNSDTSFNSSGTSTGSGSQNPNEQLVTMNQTLQSQSTQQPISEPRDLDIQQLVQEVEPEVLVEMINDLTETIKSTEQEALKTKDLYDLSKQKEQIEKAIELAKTASALAELQNKLLQEVQQSAKKPEVEKLLNTTIEQTLQENTQLTTNTQQTQQQITNTGKDAGLTQEQIDKIGPPTGSSGGTTTPPAGNQGGGGSSTSGPIISPIGTPVTPKPGVPIVFANGVSLDFGNHALDGTVTVKEITPNEADLNSKNLAVAGKILNFDFSHPTTYPVEIKFPITTSSNNIGIFYLNSNTGNWEYQPTTISADGKYAIATVNHFSTYGVLEATKVDAPIINNTNGTITITNSSGLLNAGATLYYTTNGRYPTPEGGLKFNEEPPSPFAEGTIVFKIIAYKDNMISGYSEYIDTGSISGAVTLPSGKVAPIGGIPIIIEAIPLDTYGYPDYNSPSHTSYTVIPAGQNTITYTIPYVSTGHDYILMYHIEGYGYTATDYVKSGYYSGSGTTWVLEDTEIIKINSQNKHITNKNIDLVGGRTISGKVILPSTSIYPTSLFLSAEGSTVDGKPYIIQNYIHIPEGTYQQDYTITVPINTYGFGYTVSASWDRFNLQQENPTPVDVSSMNQTNINLIKRIVPYSSYMEIPSIAPINKNFEFDIKVYDEYDDNIRGLSLSDFEFKVTDPDQNLLGNLNIVSVKESYDWMGDRYYYTVTANFAIPAGYNIQYSVKVTPYVLGEEFYYNQMQVQFVESATISGTVSLPAGHSGLSEPLEISVLADDYANYNIYKTTVLMASNTTSIDYELAVPADYDINVNYELPSYNGMEFYNQGQSPSLIQLGTDPVTVDITLTEKPPFTFTADAKNDSIRLEWDSYPNAEWYYIFVNDTEVTRLDNDYNYSILNLSPNTEYNIRIEARDWGRDFTEAFASLNVSTTNEQPINNIQFTNQTSSSFDITWDSVSGATLYKVSKNGETPETTTDSTISLTGLYPNTSYSLRIEAIDGNNDVLLAASTVSGKTLDVFTVSHFASYPLRINVYYSEGWPYKSWDYEYKVLYGINGGPLNSEYQYTPFSGGNPDESIIFIIDNGALGLTSGTEYNIQLIAYKKNGFFDTPLAESNIYEFIAQ